MSHVLTIMFLACQLCITYFAGTCGLVYIFMASVKAFDLLQNLSMYVSVYKCMSSMSTGV